MTYPYGMHGAPAVGGGLGGLPRRAGASPTVIGGEKIGSIVFSKTHPGDRYLEANGAIYDQSAFPELFSATGLIGASPVTWNSVTSGFGTNGIQAIATDGAGVWVAVGSSGTMRRSTDNGATWSSVTSGFGTTTINSVATDGAGVWVAVGSSGVMSRSTDNGATWSAVTSGFGTSNIYSVATDGAGVWIAGSAGMRRSTDNGATWSAVNDGAGASAVFVLATDRAGVWVAGSTWMSRSTDNGATWSASPVGLWTQNKAMRSLATDGAGVWVASGDSGLAIFSNDGGTQWCQFILGSVGANSMASIATDRAGVWIVCGGSGNMALSTVSYLFDSTTKFAVQSVGMSIVGRAYIRARY